MSEQGNEVNDHDGNDSLTTAVVHVGQWAVLLTGFIRLLAVLRFDRLCVRIAARFRRRKDKSDGKGTGIC